MLSSPLIDSLSSFHRGLEEHSLSLQEALKRLSLSFLSAASRYVQVSVDLLLVDLLNRLLGVRLETSSGNTASSWISFVKDEKDLSDIISFFAPTGALFEYLLSFDVHSYNASKSFSNLTTYFRYLLISLSQQYRETKVGKLLAQLLLDYVSFLIVKPRNLCDQLSRDINNNNKGSMTILAHKLLIQVHGTNNLSVCVSLCRNFLGCLIAESFNQVPRLNTPLSMTFLVSLTRHLVVAFAQATPVISLLPTLHLSFADRHLVQVSCRVAEVAWGEVFRTPLLIFMIDQCSQPGYPTLSLVIDLWCSITRPWELIGAHDYPTKPQDLCTGRQWELFWTPFIKNHMLIYQYIGTLVLAGIADQAKRESVIQLLHKVIATFQPTLLFNLIREGNLEEPIAAVVVQDPKLSLLTALTPPITSEEAKRRVLMPLINRLSSKSTGLDKQLLIKELKTIFSISHETIEIDSTDPFIDQRALLQTAKTKKHLELKPLDLTKLPPSDLPKSYEIEWLIPVTASLGLYLSTLWNEKLSIFLGQKWYLNRPLNMRWLASRHNLYILIVIVLFWWWLIG